MRKVLILLCFFVATQASSQGIEFFEGTWKEALKKAAEEDKLLFVDAFAKWCGPCKRMSKYVFTDARVGAFFNKNFVNLKLDMEEQDGVSFGHQYPVSAYPTLIFLNGDGEVVKKVKGAQQVESLLELAKTAMKANDQSDKYAALYDEGKRDFNTVYKYVKALNNAGKPSLKISNDYLSANPQISENQLALFLYEATTEADSRLFDMMLEKKELILEQVSREEFKDKVVKACEATLVKSVEFDAGFLMEEALDKCKQALGNEAEVENLKFEMEYYSQMGDDEKYYKSVEEIGKKYARKDISLYGYLVSKLEDRYKSEKKALELARRYAEELYHQDPGADHAVTFITVLVESKEYDKALKVLEDTLESGRAEGSEVSKLKSIQKYVEALKARSDS